MVTSQVVIVALAVATATAQMSGVANADNSSFVWWEDLSCSADSWKWARLGMVTGDYDCDCDYDCVGFTTRLYGFGVEYGGVAILVYKDVACTTEPNNRFDTTIPGACTDYLGWKAFKFEAC